MYLPPETLWKRLCHEIGVDAVRTSPFDTKILYLQRTLRLFGYGASTLILVFFLSTLGHSDEMIGFFMSLTLLGDVLVSMLLAVVADGLGRRRMLALSALLITGSGIVFAICSNFWVLLAAAVLGVISASGNEIGPFKAIEESTLAQLIPPSDRSAILAWYYMLGTFGIAMGTMTAGWVVQKLQDEHGWSVLDSYRVVYWAYAAIGLIKFMMSLLLSSKCERPESEPEKNRAPSPIVVNIDDDETSPLLAGRRPDNSANRPLVSPLPKKSSYELLPTLCPESQSLVIRFCTLMAVDNLAAGLAPASWITYFFNLKFNLAEGTLGSLFFATNLLAAATNLLTPSISSRIGPIKAMVLAHLPASIALALLPIPKNVGVAVTLLVLRACTNDMDQVPRQTFLVSAVLPAERTTVMGIFNVARMLSRTVGPIITGKLADMGQFWIAFVVAGSLKVTYDLLVLGMFAGYKTREEREEEEREHESRQWMEQTDA